MTDSSPLLCSGGGSLFLWRSGAMMTFVGMLAGAFGAHALQRRAGITDKDLHAWERASSYATANGLGLMVVSTHPRFSTHHFAGPAILAGGVLFSASIMLLVLKRLGFLGPITPLGGVIMMAGYVSLVV